MPRRRTGGCWRSGRRRGRRTPLASGPGRGRPAGGGRRGATRLGRRPLRRARAGLGGRPGRAGGGGRPELLLALGWCGGVWLLYAATSTNSSGACCSVRWFVPLLAPGYYVLAVLLRDFAEYRRDFLLLSGWGLGLGLVMWW